MLHLSFPHTAAEKWWVFLSHTQQMVDNKHHPLTLCTQLLAADDSAHSRKTQVKEFGNIFQSRLIMK